MFVFVNRVNVNLFIIILKIWQYDDYKKKSHKYAYDRMLQRALLV